VQVGADSIGADDEHGVLSIRLVILVRPIMSILSCTWIFSSGTTGYSAM
jgi:hypothetical protein